MMRPRRTAVVYCQGVVSASVNVKGLRAKGKHTKENYLRKKKKCDDLAQVSLPSRISFVLRAGTVNLTLPNAIFETTQFYNHPLYDNDRPGVVQPHDIGLLEFGRSLIFNDYIQPIRIQRDDAKNTNYDGVRLTASGWGRTWSDDASASVFPPSSDKRTNFINTVRKGDILISEGGRSNKGIVGHASIMASDNWVLEMPGGTSDGLEDNNRRTDCDEWWDERPTQWITVYRCPDHNVANMAAKWAYKNYYNPKGGDRKTVHIRYSLDAPIFTSTDPSYCSKLVIQSYHLGTRESVIDLTPGIALPVSAGTGILPKKKHPYFMSLIVPKKIPSYFLWLSREPELGIPQRDHQLLVLDAVRLHHCRFHHLRPGVQRHHAVYVPVGVTSFVSGSGCHTDFPAGDSGGLLTSIDDGGISQVGVTSLVSGSGCHTAFPAGDSGGLLTSIDDGGISQVGVTSLVSDSGCHTDFPAGDSGGLLTSIDDGGISQVGETCFVSGSGCHTDFPAGDSGGLLTSIDDSGISQVGVTSSVSGSGCHTDFPAGDSGGLLTSIDDGGISQVGVTSFVSDSGCHTDFPA
ncbi:Serine protease 58, partial [Operophtera brumata]